MAKHGPFRAPLRSFPWRKKVLGRLVFDAYYEDERKIVDTHERDDSGDSKVKH